MLPPRRLSGPQALKHTINQSINQSINQAIGVAVDSLFIQTVFENLVPMQVLFCHAFLASA